MQTRCSLSERMTLCPVCACVRLCHLVACISVPLSVWCPDRLVCTIACSCKVGYPFCAGTKRRRLDARLTVCRWQCCASRSCCSLACTAGARSTPHLRHHGGAVGTGALSSTCAVSHFTRHSVTHHTQKGHMQQTVLEWRVANAAYLRELWQFVLAGAGHQHRFRSCSAASSATTLSSSVCSACRIITS